MLKRLRASHPILYCILAIALFWAVMSQGGQLLVLLLTWAGPAVAAPFVQENFLLQAAGDLLGFAAALCCCGVPASCGSLPSVAAASGTGCWWA